MKVIGIVGGVASGKSQVAQMFAELGCPILDADRAGHEVLEQTDVKDALRRRWGEAVFNDDGSVNRSAVATIVFRRGTDAETKRAHDERKFLEHLVHPRIGEILARQKAELAASGRVKAVVLDAPLLLEAGWDALCDTIVLVDAPHGVRLARARQRGWTEADFDAREGAQESLEAKRRRADFILSNSDTLESARAQVARFLREYIGPADR